MVSEKYDIDNNIIETEFSNRVLVECIRLALIHVIQASCQQHY